MKRSDLTPISDVIKSLTKGTKLGEQLEQARIWEHWPDLVGKHMAGHAQPRSIRDGVLRIEVDSAVWMNRLAYQKFRLIGRINRLARKELVSDLFIELAKEGVIEEEDRGPDTPGT